MNIVNAHRADAGNGYAARHRADDTPGPLNLTDRTQVTGVPENAGFARTGGA